MKINNTQDIKTQTVAVVIWWYDSGTHRKGDIVSQHRTMEAAQRKARFSSLWGVVDVRDSQ